jgi:hypothetical protein
MKKIIASLAIVVSSILGGTAFSVVNNTAPVAEAKLINCQKWTAGRQGYATCSGYNNSLGYTANQVVVVVICRKPTWLGGGSYQLAGNWATRNSYSVATCASYYNATDPVLWFR